MGLDFTHCNARWSYSGFNRFRERIASQLGFKLTDMVGFGGKIPWSTIDDKIVPLLDHSDCDGDLSPEECRIVAPRLKEIVSERDNNDYDKIHALLLIDGMLSAASSNERLIFC